MTKSLEDKLTCETYGLKDKHRTYLNRIARIRGYKTRGEALRACLDHLITLQERSDAAKRQAAANPAPTEGPQP